MASVASSVGLKTIFGGVGAFTGSMVANLLWAGMQHSSGRWKRDAPQVPGNQKKHIQSATVRM